MKKLFLTLFILSVITNAVAFAEKAMPPVLLTPTDISKGVSKDSIKFTWQPPQNETNAKVNSYRIVISENIRFNGYSPNTGKCNVTCLAGVVNTPSYSTSLRSSNKTYYWHVQAISSNENGEWSTTNYFKTDIGVPTVTTASASPSSTLLGSNVKFSATLSGSLPSNHSVKLSYGTSIVDMTGAGNNYSVSQTPSQLGQQVFTVGIYDGSNTLKGTAFKGNFEIVKGNSAPTLSLISGNSSATVGTNYSLQIQASDVDNNLKSINVDWGDGKNDTQNATNGTTLNFTHAYTTANIYTWSAMATDSANATSGAVSKGVSVTAANVTPPVSTTGYTKISNIGAALPDTAKLGGGANDWACTKDNKTGLIWEVKTDDGGLRDKDWRYSWYEPDASKNGGFAGYQNGDGHPEGCSGSDCDTYAYKNAVNKKTLCGTADWRLPTKDELMKLIVCLDGKDNAYNDDGSCTYGGSVASPTINTNYFPNTQYWYWSSSPDDRFGAIAWDIYFKSGYSDGYGKQSTLFVRLVHDAGVSAPTTVTTKLNDTGITTCSNATTKNLPCPVSDFPNQDAQSGRDATNNDDSDGHAGFSFTKISNTGESLTASATSWNCVKDNVTGLMWEVKTTDGGLHDQNHTYTWYEPDNTKNGGSAGTQNKGICKESPCDTNAYVKAVNLVGYCGYKDWRTPTIQELTSIVDISRFDPAIDINYFPRTHFSGYWSSSPSANGNSYAWYFNFGNGTSGNSLKSVNNVVWLVR